MNRFRSIKKKCVILFLVLHIMIQLRFETFLRNYILKFHNVIILKEKGKMRASLLELLLRAKNIFLLPLESVSGCADKKQTGWLLGITRILIEFGTPLSFDFIGRYWPEVEVVLHLRAIERIKSSYTSYPFSRAQ